MQRGTAGWHWNQFPREPARACGQTSAAIRTHMHGIHSSARDYEFGIRDSGRGIWDLDVLIPSTH